MEKAVIKKTNSPSTKDSLVKNLIDLGVKPGMTILVHNSMSSIGWVSGGEQAIVEALMQVITTEGTIIMPTQTTQLSDPSEWGNPPVPESWWETIRQTMPAYDPKITPTRGMGKVVELFRTFPGVIRSNHPNYSFAAWGKHSRKLMENHSIDYGLGENSPLRKLYDAHAYTLLIGVFYDNATALHLAEYRCSAQERTIKYAPMNENGHRVWQPFQDIVFKEELFCKLGKAYEAEQHSVIEGIVGLATARLVPVNELVDFAVSWLNNVES